MKDQGVIAYDTSGNGYNCSIFGATYVNGRFGFALSFDGVNDYLAIQNLHYNTPNGITELTVTAWVKVPPDGGDWSIVDFDRSEYYCCPAGIRSDRPWGEGDYVGFHTYASGYGIHDMWSNSPIRDDNWHFIAWVYDSSVTNDKKFTSMET